MHTGKVERRAWRREMYWTLFFWRGIHCEALPSMKAASSRLSLSSSAFKLAGSCTCRYSIHTPP